MPVVLIVGLGNPGQRYCRTRHNLGFDVIDLLACRYAIPMQHREARALCGRGEIEHRAILLVKPQTYMNLSGQAVVPLVRRYLPQGAPLIVVHDDIDLPLGRIKLKQRGGDAGHRGVRSIIEGLGTGEFVRVRMGVGHPAPHEDIVDYVLSPFAAGEVAVRDAMIAQAAASVRTLVAEARLQEEGHTG